MTDANVTKEEVIRLICESYNQAIDNSIQLTNIKKREFTGNGYSHTETMMYNGIFDSLISKLESLKNKP